MNMLDVAEPLLQRMSAQLLALDGVRCSVIILLGDDDQLACHIFGKATRDDLSTALYMLAGGMHGEPIKVTQLTGDAGKLFFGARQA
jgi:hypothetical protein